MRLQLNNLKQKCERVEQEIGKKEEEIRKCKYKHAQTNDEALKEELASMLGVLAHLKKKVGNGILDEEYQMTMEAIIKAVEGQNHS